MKVSQIMTRKVVTIGADASILRVSSILTKKRFHGVPVVDENKKIIGIITETDFFIKDSAGLHLPSYVTMLQQLGIEKKVSFFRRKQLGKILSATAGDIMTTKCITVTQETDLKKVMKIIKDFNLSTIPVVDNSKRVVGIVTISDILKLI